MIDGLLVTKSLVCMVSHLIVGGGGSGVFSPRKVLYFSTPMTAIPCIF
jgi:methyl coenzyme M reductase beta subunit